MERSHSNELFAALDFWSTWFLSRKRAALFVPKSLVVRLIKVLSHVGAAAAAREFHHFIEEPEMTCDRVRIAPYGAENRAVFEYFLSRQEDLPQAGREILTLVKDAFNSYSS